MLKGTNLVEQNKISKSRERKEERELINDKEGGEEEKVWELGFEGYKLIKTYEGFFRELVYHIIIIIYIYIYMCVYLKL